MWGEFKEFIGKGNVLDLAVGVIIGAAFGKIVSALTDEILMPLLGLIMGGVDFSNKFLLLGTIPESFKGNPASYADLKAAGISALGYGSFINATINFLIMAFVIFQLVKLANRMMPPKEAGPSEIDLLTEIRDSLKK